MFNSIFITYHNHSTFVYTHFHSVFLIRMYMMSIAMGCDLLKEVKISVYVFNLLSSPFPTASRPLNYLIQDIVLRNMENTQPTKCVMFLLFYFFFFINLFC